MSGLATELAAVLALLVATAALGLASKEWWLFGPVAVLVLATKPLLTGRVPPGRAVYVALGVPCLILALVSPVDGTSGLGLNVPFHIALFLLLAGLVQLAGPPSPLRVPFIIFCAASPVAAIGADVDRRPYLAIVGAFALPFVVLLRGALLRPGGSRRATWARLGLIAVALVLTGAVELVSVRVIDRNYDKINDAFLRLMRERTPQAGGFSGKAQLGSVMAMKGGGGRGITLRAFSAKSPGYLRGKAFYVYARGDWQALKGIDRRVQAGRVALEGRPAPPAGAPPALAIYPASDYGAHFFLPLHATAVDTPCEGVNLLPGPSVESRDRPTTAGYGVHLDPGAPGEGRGDDRALELPQDPEVLRALDATLAKIATPREPARAASALQAYFAHAYRYQVGIDLPPGKDPIARFLDEKDHGHCELFATAGTLLLRRLGLRARYVTGFICEEKNPVTDDLWVARQQHGHAWTEWLDPGKGWRTIDLTPSSGVPVTDGASGLEAWLEALGGEWERFTGDLAQRGLGAALGRFLAGVARWFVSAWWRPALLLVVLAGLAVRKLKRRLRARVVQRETELPPELASERERVLALSRELAPRGLARREAETLLEWAGRIDRSAIERRSETVALIRGYVERRYAPRPGATAGKRDLPKR